MHELKQHNSSDPHDQKLKKIEWKKLLQILKCKKQNMKLISTQPKMPDQIKSASKRLLEKP